jgi:hypothetical protein
MQTSLVIVSDSADLLARTADGLRQRHLFSAVHALSSGDLSRLPGLVPKGHRLLILPLEPSAHAAAESGVGKSGIAALLLDPPDPSRWIDLLAEHLAAALEEPPPAPILMVEGRVDTPGPLNRRDLASLPGQIPDVGALVPGRRGRAVRVRSLLDHAGVSPSARAVTFYSGDAFSADLPLAQAAEAGLLVYELDGRPLSADLGGPVRLFVPGADDRCANVKAVDRIAIRD